jgi:hypothetical protein
VHLIVVHVISSFSVALSTVNCNAERRLLDEAVVALVRLSLGALNMSLHSSFKKSPAVVATATI